MENLGIYSQVRKAPDNALRPITDGYLKGKSDINPQWRIEMLTSIFGPCGFGWYTTIDKMWVERDGQESCAWVELSLMVKHPETGQWSAPIKGLGGSKQFGKGKGSGVINEEAFKMAETDAISVACKKLGFAADVYWDITSTKYTQGGPQIVPQPQAGVPNLVPQAAPQGAQVQQPVQAVPQPQAVTQPPVQVPQPSQQATPQAAVPSLAEAIELANKADSKEAIEKVWLELGGLYGKDSSFRYAVAHNKFNAKSSKK